MTSDRAIGANRRNARASTGPRTTAGKTRAAQNARKHGLSITQAAPDASPDVERLAAAVMGDRGADPALWDAARVIAETQSHLRHVLAVKLSLIRDCVPQPDRASHIDSASAPVAIRDDLLLGLERLERYERRAFSRRKTAMRQFEQLASRVGRPTWEVAPE